MNSDQILATLEKYRVIPVITIESVKDALPLADALLAGGLPIAEITFRTAAAAEVISAMTRGRPNLLVGAGTVLTVENLQRARDCGAVFGVAPGFNPKVVSRATQLGMPFIPGVNNPTDIEAAMDLGCRLLKFFPAGASGGTKMLSAISVPYLHTGVKFMPSGGVNQDNLKEYFAVKGVLAVGGTWLASKDDIQQGRWDVITENCRKALAAVGAV
jgi:2-dehydro-3-deoxyphosphogluconate aldolase/(4S)-4-hydroxy-2-oxoglutarate aldolase